jgi:hypothetical protein
VRIVLGLALRVVLAMDRDPLLRHHAGRQPEPEAEEVRRDRMQLERPVRLRPVQKIVTAAIVMWVATSVNRAISHPLQPKSPFASQLSTASDIDIRKSMNPAFVQRQNGR